MPYLLRPRAVDRNLAAALDESRTLAERLARAETEARTRDHEIKRVTAAHDELDDRLGRREVALETEREARETAERRVEVLEATLAEARESAGRAAAAAAGTCRETIERAQRRADALETRLAERDAALAEARTETAVLAERLAAAETDRDAARERVSTLETAAADDDAGGTVLARLGNLERRLPPADND